MIKHTVIQLCAGATEHFAIVHRSQNLKLNLLRWRKHLNIITSFCVSRIFFEEIVCNWNSSKYKCYPHRSFLGLKVLLSQIWIKRTGYNGHSNQCFLNFYLQSDQYAMVLIWDKKGITWTMHIFHFPCSSLGSRIFLNEVE